MRWFHAPLLGVFLLTANAAMAEAPPQGQRTAAAQNMNNALQKIRTQQVPHLEQTLKERNLPPSVAKLPTRIFEHGVEHAMKPRLQLGLTQDPTVQQGPTTSVEVRGNANSTTEARVHISATTGNINGVTPTQHVQVTADNAPPTPAARPYRDPRAGIQLTDHDVVQWKNQGTSTNPQAVSGRGLVRTFTPVSPGLKFRGEALPAGSHLVTTQSGLLNMNFQPAPSGAFASATPAPQPPAAPKPAAAPNTPAAPAAAPAPTTRTTTYLLVPKGDGAFKRVKLTEQELADLKASTATRSFTVQQGAVNDNTAPGYTQEKLRSGGFIQ